MENSSVFISSDPAPSSSAYKDPIISIEDVKWAARRFILVYGDQAPEMALKQVDRLDRVGKIRIAEMFQRVGRECARLLKQSENLRIYPVN